MKKNKFFMLLNKIKLAFCKINNAKLIISYSENITNYALVNYIIYLFKYVQSHSP